MPPGVTKFVSILTLVAIPIAGHRIWKNLTVVPEMTVHEVRRAVEALDDSVVIVDVRSPAESNVSIIPGAVTRLDFEREIDRYKGKRVITYCTVGLRSAAYARKLRSDGWDGWNYSGSILDWCRHKLPLVTPDAKPTNRVHTYSTEFGAPFGYEAVN